MCHFRIVWCQRSLSKQAVSDKQGSESSSTRRKITWRVVRYKCWIQTERPDITGNLSIAYLERVMDVISDRETGVSIHGNRVNNSKFADDLDLKEDKCE